MSTPKSSLRTLSESSSMRFISPNPQKPKPSRAPFRNSTGEEISTALLCSFRFQVVFTHLSRDRAFGCKCHSEYDRSGQGRGRVSCLQSGPTVQWRLQNTCQHSLRSAGDDTLPADILLSEPRSPSLHLYKILTYRKRAVIIGNSALVGYPCFCMLQRMGCTCSMCHKDTVDVPSYTREVRRPS